MMNCLSRFLVLLTLAVATAMIDEVRAMGQGKALVRCYDDDKSSGELAIKLGKQEVAKIIWSGSEKDIEVGPFAWPDGIRQVTFQGNLNWVHYRRGKVKSALANTVPIIDITDLTKPLRKSELAWPKRLLGFQKSQVPFMEQHPEFASEIDIALEPGEKAREAKISAAEKRLGFKLPPEHVLTLSEFGCWRYDDSWMMEPDQLTNAYDQMIKVWETPATAMESLPAATKEFLRSGVILFTMSGDGYGAIIYQPAQAGSATDAPAYYEVQQDSIVEPRLLKNQDGSHKDYVQTMLWLLAQEVLARLDSLGLNVCFVDHGAIGPVVYRISHETVEKQEVVQMSLDWTSFE